MRSKFIKMILLLYAVFVTCAFAPLSLIFVLSGFFQLIEWKPFGLINITTGLGGILGCAGLIALPLSNQNFIKKNDTLLRGIQISLVTGVASALYVTTHLIRESATLHGTAAILALTASVVIGIVGFYQLMPRVEIKKYAD